MALLSKWCQTLRNVVFIIDASNIRVDASMIRQGTLTCGAKPYETSLLS